MTNLPAKQNALMPSNITQAMELAKMMAESKLVPKDLQSKPADCLLVIEQAMRWGMSPFAVAQCTSVIHGKLMYEGKLVGAVVNATGNLSKRLSYKFEGIGSARKIIISGRLQGEAEDRTIELTVKDARTTNENWTKQPDQQLVYAGTRVWARRHVPELMLGVYAVEEVEDARAQVTDAIPIDVPPQTPILENTPIEQPYYIEVPKTKDGMADDWMEWGGQLVNAYNKCDDIDDLERWAFLNKQNIDSVLLHAPLIHKRIMDRFGENLKRLLEVDQNEPQ